MNDRIHVSVMAKYPKASVAKTRLGRAIGMDVAAELSMNLIKDLILDLQSANIEFSVETDSPDSKSSFEEDYQHVVVNTGEGSHVIERLRETLQRNCSLYRKSVCVFSDVPLLNSTTVKESLAALETNDVVLGPDDGGGLYLVGMKEFRDLFSLQEKGKYFCEVRNNARSLFASLSLLEEKFDIDVAGDLEKIDLTALAATKPNTHRFLLERLPDLY